MSRIRLIKIGCDPEFGFLNSDGDFVDAESVVARRQRFGLDGCESIAELRPLPSLNPSQLVKNIHDDLTRGYRDNKGTRSLYWKAGSSIADYGIGGHIHFGLNAVIPYHVRRNSFAQIVKYMDTYLTQVCRLLEDRQEMRSRLENDYGYISDYRENAHGLEYRTLGSWLTSPRVAEGVLCLAQTIACQAIWGSYSIPAQLVPDSDDSCDKYRTRLPVLISRIRQFNLYKRHTEPIEFIFELAKRNKTWFPGDGVDMKVAWDLPHNVGLAAIKDKELPPVKLDDIWKRGRD